MHNKTIAAGALFLLATLAPAAMGHDERAAGPGSPAGLGTNDDGVSGVYVGAAGPAIAIQASTVAFFAMLCDLEVVVDAEGFPLNEEDVDGNAGGLMPNTVDDGGFGFACHLRTYQTDDYNTNGCLTGQSAGGHDFVSPLDLWLGAGCDYQTNEGGLSGGLGFLACLIGEVVLQTDPTALLPCVNAIVDCTLDSTCQDGQVSCGSDTFVDAIHYGYGSGANGVKAEFPTNPCPPGPATTLIAAFDTVATNGGSAAVYPAIIGDIWTDTSSGGDPYLYPCDKATATDPAVFEYDCLGDEAEYCAIWLSDWQPPAGPARNQCLPCAPPSSDSSFDVRSPLLPSLPRYASGPGHEQPPTIPPIPPIPPITIPDDPLSPPGDCS